MRHLTLRIAAVTMMLLSIIAHAVVPHHNHHGVVVTMHQGENHNECSEHHTCGYVTTVRQCESHTLTELNIPEILIILPRCIPDLVPAERLLLRLSGPRRAPPRLMALARTVRSLRAPPSGGKV